MPTTVRVFVAMLTLALYCGWCIAQSRPSKDEICERYNRSTAPSTITPNSPDEVANWWNKYKKYMLVVHPTDTGVDTTKLEFSKVNARFLADKLSGIGFEPINGERILEGSKADYSNFVRLLNYVAQEFSDNSIVLIYYCGHAVITADGRDLELELHQAHADRYSPNRLRVRELVDKVRNGFKGELILVLDACHSGQASLNNQVAEQLSNTVILSSSHAAKKSFILKNNEASAYSQFFVDALSDGWEQADENQNGMLEFQELNDYIKIRLKCAKDRGEIEGTMDPLPFVNSQLRFLAYNPGLARKWDDPFRTQLTLEAFMAANLTVSYTVELYTAEGTPASRGPIFYPQIGVTTSLFKPNIAESAKLVKSLPDTSDPLLVAMVNMERGDFERARSALQTAFAQKRWPDKTVFQMAGILSLRFKQYEEALEYFRRALSTDPNDPAVWLQIAEVQAIVGRMEFARSSFDVALLKAQERYGTRHLEVARVLEKYAAFLSSQKGGQPGKDDADKARELRIRLEAVRRKLN